MNTLLLLAAGSLSSVWLCVHLFMGGRQIARPLRQSVELQPVVRDTQYLCWHFTSVGIAAIALFFFLAAFTGMTAFAVSGALLAAGFAAVGIALVVNLGGSHIDLPQGWLFVPVAALGILGILL